MATVTKTIIPGYRLTGNTVSPDSAPISYTVSTPSGSFGPLVGAQIANFRLIAVDDNNTRVVLDDGASFVLPNSSLSAFNTGITQAFNQIRTEIPKLVTTTSTNVTTGPEIVVTAPKKIVANTADVPISIATIPDTPLSVPATPFTIDVPEINAKGKVTGTTKITIGEPPLVTDPGPLVTVDTANIQIPLTPLPDFASDEAAILDAESQATAQDQANFAAKEDWRVRLSLAPDSQYLYNAPDPGILKPLSANGGTDGVIFPYTPSISVNYAASYEQTNLVHSNYKIFQYSGSGVDSVSIGCAFTAQDEYEANYLLAVIHFFRSMTKMFYGQDDNPKNGTPPPLCYMYGMGGYQFAAHPLAIQGFSYTLPDDVDYIKTTSASPAGTPKPGNSKTPSDTRLAGTGVSKGGKGPGPEFANSPTTESVTWVPTRIQMTITCVPIMSRNAISNRFSLRDYASGKLLNGTRQGATGGGMW